MADLIVETFDNPIPEGTVAGMLETADGFSLRYARVPPRGPARGSVIVLPGRNEYIEKYLETAADLAARGYGSAILDWRGQGGSQRLLSDPDRGHVEDFSDYLKDIDALFRSVVLPDCRAPYSILAHSTGALVALLAAPGLTNRVGRMVLCSPLLGLAVSPAAERWVRRLADGLYALGLGRLYMPGSRNAGKAPPFSRLALSADHRRYERNRQTVLARPGLAIRAPTVAWTRAMFKAVDRVREPDFMGRIHVPALFLAAGVETVVSSAAIEHYARHLRGGSVLTVHGARHELLQETDYYREQVLAALVAFTGGERAKSEAVLS